MKTIDRAYREARRANEPNTQERLQEMIARWRNLKADAAARRRKMDEARELRERMNR